VRRLGYLLEHFGHERQARALQPKVQHAKSVKPLNPAAKPFLERSAAPINTDWQLLLNQTIEVDE